MTSGPRPKGGDASVTAFADLPADLHHVYLQYAPVGEQIRLRELCSNAAKAVAVRVRDDAIETIIAQSLTLGFDEVPAFAALRDFRLSPTAEELIGAVQGPAPAHLDVLLSTVARYSPLLLWPHASPMSACVARWLEEAAGDPDDCRPSAWALVPDPATTGRAAALVSSTAAGSRQQRRADPVPRMERFLHDYGVVAIRRAAADPQTSLTDLLKELYDRSEAVFRYEVPDVLVACEDDEDGPDLVPATRTFSLTPPPPEEGRRSHWTPTVDTVLMATLPNTGGGNGPAMSASPSHICAKHIVYPLDTALIVPPGDRGRHAATATAQMPARWFTSITHSVDFSMCDPDLEIHTAAFRACGARFIDLSPLNNLASVGAQAFGELAVERLLLPQHYSEGCRDPHVRHGGGVFTNMKSAVMPIATSPWLEVLPLRMFVQAELNSINLSGLFSVQNIDDCCFAECRNLHAVEAWPPRLNRLGSDAFAQCGLVGELRFDSITDSTGLVIEDRCFLGNEALTSVVLPACLEELKQQAFAVTSSGLTSIDFSACTRLTAIGVAAIAPTVRNVDVRNTKLRTFTAKSWGQWSLPGTVRLIDSRACDHIPIFAPLETGARPPVLSPQCFQRLHLNVARNVDLTGLPWLTEIPDECFAKSPIRTLKVAGLKLKRVGKKAFFECRDFDATPLLKSQALHLEVLDESAFRRTATTTAVLGPALRHLSSQVFAESKVKAVHAKQSCPIYVVQIGCFAGCLKLHQVDLATGFPRLLRIADRCFEGSKHLTDVKFPESLQSIGVAAFCGAEELASCDLSRCAELLSIESGAFDQCRALTTVEMAASAKLGDVQHSAFSNCPVLRRVSVDPAVGKRLVSSLHTMIPPEALVWEGKTAGGSVKKNAWAKPLAQVTK